jgi:hypothetical protein
MNQRNDQELAALQTKVENQSKGQGSRQLNPSKSFENILIVHHQFLLPEIEET